jgi:GGDEF domain-containing protein
MERSPEGTNLDLKTIEQLARLFNVAFNGALLYGGDHPTTKKSAEPFFGVLSAVLPSVSSLSIVYDRESLFIEDTCIDKVINPKRIMSQFVKAGIVSVTFELGVRLEDIQTFIRICGVTRETTTIDDIIGELKSAGVRGIRLNYIRYGKITDDQAIVGRDEYSGAASEGIVGHAGHTSEFQNLSSETLEQLQSIVSLSSLLEQPRKTASVLKSGIENPDSQESTINALGELRKEITSSNPPSLDVLLNAVFELKNDLVDAIEIQKATGRILSASEPVTAQVDNLTVDVIVKLVKEEYGSGSLSLKRLSQIVLRMLPDLNELKRVLPRLKNVLMEQGMPLTDYCQLVTLLDAEVQSEMLSGSLSEAAEGIGVSVKEIVTAIKAQPTEAARLIYLAAEIKQGANNDDSYLSTLLTEYIEKVSTDLALDKKEVGGPQGSQVLRSMLQRLEEQLVEKMKSYGVEGSVMLQVQNQLSSRFEQLVGNASDQWISTIIPDDHSAADSAVAKITSFFGQAFTSDKTRDSLIGALKNKGYNQQRIDLFFNRLTEQVASGQTTNLPANILSSNNMLFLLNREIKLQTRYSIPLSTMMITVSQIAANGAFREAHNDEIDILLPQIFTFIKKSLRETDLVGSLGKPFTSTVFIIMSMTSEEDAVTVSERIKSSFDAHKFAIGNDSVIVQPVVSVSFYEKNSGLNLKEFLELAAKKHKGKNQ